VTIRKVYKLVLFTKNMKGQTKRPIICSLPSLGRTIHNYVYGGPDREVVGTASFDQRSDKGSGDFIVTRRYAFAGYEARVENCQYGAQREIDDEIQGDLRSGLEDAVKPAVVEMLNWDGRTMGVKVRRAEIGEDVLKDKE
jgi:hypothetical protein